MTIGYRRYQRAEQVQPQNGQLLFPVYDVDLRACPPATARRYPQAARQAVNGQRLMIDRANGLFLVHPEDIWPEE